MTEETGRRSAVVADPGNRRAFFEEEGYLIVEDVLSVEELGACREEVDRLHDLYGELVERDDPAAKNFQKEPYAKVEGGRPALRKIEQTAEVSELFRGLAHHPRLLEVVKEILGPDLLLFRSTLMLKPAFHGSIHALHQDSAYWSMEPPALVTVSIALNDTSEENGCIQVIPRSHSRGIEDWGQIAREQNAALTDRGDIDSSDLVPAPVRAGSALMFHSLLVHGSGPNRSPNPRNTALYAFFPPTVRYHPKKNDPAERTYRVISGCGGESELTMQGEGRD